MIPEKWLVAVGAGHWQVPGIVAARAEGLKVLALDGNPKAEGFRHADLSATADIRDASEVLAAVARSGIEPSGAVAFVTEAGMISAAALREHYGLPGPGLEVARALTNKALQRQRWSATGLPCPQWVVLRAPEDLGRMHGGMGERIIFKPVDAAGSRAVTVVTGSDQWLGAFNKAKGASLSGSVIAETFVEGVEHTVDTFSHAGVCHILSVTIKKKLEGTNDTVASEIATCEMDPAKRSELTGIVSRALAALGHTDGPGHTEVLQTGDGRFFLVESAGRAGGFMVGDGIATKVSGFDLARATALQAVGLDPGSPPTLGKARFAVLRFIPSRAGRVEEIRGFDVSDELEGAMAEALVKTGDSLHDPTCDGDRIAYVLAVSDSPSKARKLVDQRTESLNFKISSPNQTAPFP